jgi:hypothetical protein
LGGFGSAFQVVADQVCLNREDRLRNRRRGTIGVGPERREHEIRGRHSSAADAESIAAVVIHDRGLEHGADGEIHIHILDIGRRRDDAGKNFTNVP